MPWKPENQNGWEAARKAQNKQQTAPSAFVQVLQPRKEYKSALRGHKQE